VQKPKNAQRRSSVVMAKTVKARVHHGAESLDLTIPVELVREHDISEGDVFEITAHSEYEGLELRYKRVYDS
jgi:hypothetical protein